MEKFQCIRYMAPHPPLVDIAQEFTFFMLMGSEFPCLGIQLISNGYDADVASETKDEGTGFSRANDL